MSSLESFGNRLEHARSLHVALDKMAGFSPDNSALKRGIQTFWTRFTARPELYEGISGRCRTAEGVSPGISAFWLDARFSSTGIGLFEVFNLQNP